MSEFETIIEPKLDIKVKDDFQKLFGENCSVVSVRTSQICDQEIIHQVTTKYKNKLFLNVISESENNYTVLSIQVNRKFQTGHQPKVDNINFPITTFENQVSIHLETIHNFSFDKNKVIKIYDKMLESKINFNEII